MDAQSHWTLAWGERPSEEARTLNPAFCAELIARTVGEFHKTRRAPLNFAAAFTVLPLVLHKPTRDSLPGRASAVFAGWVAEHNPIVAELPGRAGRLRPVSREALLFAIRHRLLMVDGSATTGMSMLESILRNTAGIIADQDLDADKELDVDHAIAKIVRYTFPDFVDKPQIDKAVTKYKPDFGVKSLGALIEYKFALDEVGVKVALEGISADMINYAGDPNWGKFYAVVYTTQPILHSDVVEEHFKSSTKEGDRWSIIFVNGPGRQGPKVKDKKKVEALKAAQKR